MEAYKRFTSWVVELLDTCIKCVDPKGELLKSQSIVFGDFRRHLLGTENFVSREVRITCIIDRAMWV